MGPPLWFNIYCPLLLLPRWSAPTSLNLNRIDHKEVGGNLTDGARIAASIPLMGPNGQSDTSKYTLSNTYVVNKVHSVAQILECSMYS